MTKPRLGNLAVTGAVSTGAITKAHESERGEVLRQVDPRTLTPSPFQPRGPIDRTSDAFTALVESVQAHGILQPPTVRELASGALELLAGERRTHAAIAANLPTIPVRVRANVSDAEARALALLENLARENLTPWEEAQGLAALRDALGREGQPSTVRALATLTGRSIGHVSESLSIADRLTRSVMTQAGVTDVQAMNSLTRDALKNAMGATDTPPQERAKLLRMVSGKRARRKQAAPPVSPLSPPPAFTLTGANPRTGPVTLRVKHRVADLTPADARALLDTLAPLLKALRARVAGR